MTYLKRLEKVIYRAAGAATRVLGKDCVVYRLNANVNGSIFTPEAIALAKFAQYGSHDSSKKLIETQIFDLVAYSGTMNANKLKVGDILVEFGDPPTQRYCVAQIRDSSPFKVVLMKVETDAQIRFAKSDAGTADSTQTTVSKVDRDYGGSRRNNQGHLALVNGVYAKATVGGVEAATVPIGVQMKDRIRDDHDPNLPTQLRKTQMLCYIPPMPGYIPKPLDVLYEGPDREWTIAECRSNVTDLEGTVCILDTNAA